jgi:hypothetical protein
MFSHVRALPPKAAASLMAVSGCFSRSIGVKLLARHLERLGKIRLADPQFRHDDLVQQRAGVGGTPVIRVTLRRVLRFSHSKSSVIILQIDIDSVAVAPAESDATIARHRHCELALSVSFKRMKA